MNLGASEKCSCGAVFVMVNAGPNETRASAKEWRETHRHNEVAAEVAAEATPEPTTCPTCYSLTRRYRHRVQAGGVVKMADCPDPWHDY